MLTENLSKRVLKYWYPRGSESQPLNRGGALIKWNGPFDDNTQRSR